MPQAGLLLQADGSRHDWLGDRGPRLTLVAAIDAITRPLADKAYDTNPFRAVLAKRQIEPVIPSIRRRKPLIPHDATAYRQRNLIERIVILNPQARVDARHIPLQTTRRTAAERAE